MVPPHVKGHPPDELATSLSRTSELGLLEPVTTEGSLEHLSGEGLSKEGALSTSHPSANSILLLSFSSNLEDCSLQLAAVPFIVEGAEAERNPAEQPRGQWDYHLLCCGCSTSINASPISRISLAKHSAFVARGSQLSPSVSRVLVLSSDGAHVPSSKSTRKSCSCCSVSWAARSG